MNFAYRSGRFWRVGKTKKAFRSPAPTGAVMVEEGATVLYRLSDHEVIFPGDGQIVTIRDMHGLLTRLVEPAGWPLGRIPAPKPVQTLLGVSSGLSKSVSGTFPDGLANWVERLLADPEQLETDLTKPPGWTQRVLDGDRDVLAVDSLDNIEWSGEGIKDREGVVDASVRIRPVQARSE